MKRRTRRLSVAILSLVLVAGATILVLRALPNAVTFFYSPTELAAMAIKPDSEIRVGGLVVEQSLENRSDHGYKFEISDLNASLIIYYDGLLPNLFREGQGVVVQGVLETDGSFVASEVLAKHDETYMPPEVAEALKASGEWRPGDE